MPTGITAPIYEGKDITRKEYILRCARSFGPLAHMRDLPMNAPIEPQIVDFEYYNDNINRTLNQYAYYLSLSDEEIEKTINEEYEEAVTQHEERLAKYEVIRQRYEAMLDQVRKWNPPSKDHTDLKEFAINQIESCMVSDCSTARMKFPAKETASEWLEERLGSSKSSFDYYVKRRKEGIERVLFNSNWVSQLLVSLVDLEDE